MEERKRQFVEDHEIARSEGTLHEFYEKYAQTYDEIMSTTGYQDIQQHAASLLKQHLSDVEQPLVLDVGCGTGFSGVYLKKVGFQQIHGTDPSPGSLKEAELKGVYTKVYRGLITDTEQLQCESDSYDAIFCIGTITKGHLEVRHALREFLRVVKAGGICVFTIRNDKLDQKDMMAAFGEGMQEGSFELISMEKRTYYVDAYCLCCVVRVL